jgi:hypothetical protein
MNVSISRDGVELGEWSEEQVRASYKEGHLLPTDHYWKEGMTEWAELSKMIKPPPPPPKILPPTDREEPTSKAIESQIVEPKAEQKPVSKVVTPPPFKEKVPTKVGPKPFKQQVIEATLFLVTVVAWIAGAASGKLFISAYPQGAQFVFIGSVFGLALFAIPYCIFRFGYKSKHAGRYLYIGSFIGALLGVGYWHLYFTNQLAVMSYMANTKCPLMVDQVTRLDSTSVDGHYSFHYHYTFVGTNITVDNNQLQTTLRDGILNGYRTSPTSSFFRDNGVSLHYDYYDLNSNHIGSIIVGPQDLK